MLHGQNFEFVTVTVYTVHPPRLRHSVDSLASYSTESVTTVCILFNTNTALELFLILYSLQLYNTVIYCTHL